MACQGKPLDNTHQKAASGAEIYKKYCINCHGANGTLMTNGAKNLQLSNLSLEERILIVTQGRNVMTAFKNTLSENQIEAVCKYTLTLHTKSANGQ